MNNAELRGRRIIGAPGAVEFLKEYFEGVGGSGDMQSYFASWSPYRIRRIEVRLIGPKEVHRPDFNLEGIKGTMRMYQLMEDPVSNRLPSSMTTLVGGQGDGVMAGRTPNGSEGAGDNGTNNTAGTGQVIRKYHLKTRTSS